MTESVAVIKLELMVDEHVINTVYNLMFLKIRAEYEGGALGINAGDKVEIKIDNTANEIFNIVGYGHNTINIYGDGDIGKVGTRTYRNDADGNFYLEIEFDAGYYNYFGGDMPDNIVGWLESSVYVLYKKWVQEPTSTSITVVINGTTTHIDVNAEPGGGPGPERPDTPGPIIGKSGRYGAYSGNLGDLPEVEFNDYLNFDPMRWGLQVGYQNLTWRDLRATKGASYFTTEASLLYSNQNPTGERYQSNNESYLMPYALQQGHPIDAPFHHENCVLEDYLVTGQLGNTINSAHEYVKDSIRIIRVMGREANTPWWGRDAFRALADSNFLKHDPSEPIDRYLPGLYFEGRRGLTIDEFLQQMHKEGQLLDKSTADDILSFAHANNGDAPGTPTPWDTTQIPHFKLLLGDLRFAVDTTINIIGFDNSVIFENVPAKNLPYGYWVYYDTKATEAVLDHDSFHYNNSATFKFNDEVHSVNGVGLWIKLEDGSGGSGHTTEVRLKKIDENGEPVQGVKFILTQTNLLPPHTREAFTTINGTASFTLRKGAYTLTEEVPVGSNLVPITPMEFTITNTDELLNLKEILKDLDYPDWDKLSHENNVNIITNYSDIPPIPPTPPTPDICESISDVIKSIAKQEMGIARILKAEAEKLQTITRREGASFKELMEANQSVIKLIDSVTRLEAMLHAKLSALPFEKCLGK